MGNPMPTTKKALHSTIRDDYFDEADNEKNDIVSPIALIASPRSPTNPPLQRSRSKSMGSFTDSLDKKTEIKKIVSDKPNNENPLTLSAEILKKSNQRSSDNRISSPIYKELAESSKKLTLITFGPSRRPTHGMIHCAIKVETYDFKGQILAKKLKVHKKPIYFITAYHYLIGLESQ